MTATWPFNRWMAADLVATCAWPAEAEENRRQWSPRLLDDSELREATVTRARERFEAAVDALDGAGMLTDGGGTS